MEASAFREKGAPPDEGAVASVLGPSSAAWKGLRERLAEGFGPLQESWAFSGAKLGWALRIARRKRPLVYLTPLTGRFRASLALPEAAMEAVRERLPAHLVALAEAAPVYSEGRAVRLEVGSLEALDDLLAFVAIRADS